jgi:predicted DNA-binding transcriptional regulator YafY
MPTPSEVTIQPEKPRKKRPDLFSRKDEHAITYARPLNKAIRANHKGHDHTVTVEYQKANGDRVVRKIKPLGAKKNLLFAFDHERSGVRSFRIDRINTLHKNASELSPFWQGFLRAVGAEW